MGYYDEYLEHHGILGQKWGVRRFESASGHLTAAGRARYNSVDGEYQKVKNKNASAKVESTGKKEENKEEKKGLSDKQKKALKIAGAAVGTALVAYGGYKLYQLNKEATEGISKNYSKKADQKINESLDYFKLQSEPLKNATNWQNSILPEGIKKAGYADALNRAAEYKNKSNAALEEGRKLESLAKSKNYSISEKVNYLKDQKNSNFSSKAAVTKARKQYAKDQSAWYRKTVNLEQKKAFAERLGDTKTAAKIDKKLASSPPPLPVSASKKGQQATSKLASEASNLARSVTTEGPKSFSSRTAQNSANAVRAMTSQKLANASRTTSSGRQTTQRVMSVAGRQKFNQASQANNDLVNDLLRRNASMLSGF